MLSQKIPWYYSFPVIILSTLLAVILIYAWQEPTAPPPGGNVPAPINVGASTQYKAGALGIGGVLQSDSIGVFNSGLKIGNSPLQEAGVIRWTGSDFQGYTGSSWLSLTAGGGGVSLDRVVRLEKCLAQGITNVLCKKIDGSGNCVSQASGEDLYSECPSGYACNGAGACKKEIAQTCSSPADCLSGYCVDGVCCDTACDGLCKKCNLAGSEGTCTNIPSGQNPDNECGGSSCCGYCDGSGSCAYVASGSTCTSPGDSCTAGNVCNGSGICKKALGETCSASEECLSGYCVDGVCCDTACDGLCKKCNLAGSEGTCTNIPSGQNPDNECGGSSCCGYCDGSGSCAYVASGSTCTSPGDSCTAGNACNGSGICKKTLGETCSASEECLSGYCVDGVCCDTACTGKICQRCDSYSINGSGHCGYVKSSTEDPDGECTDSGCGSGYCKGDDYGCGFYTSGERNCPVCQTCNGATSPSCVNISAGQYDTEGVNTCTATHYRCDGSGSCTAPKSESCHALGSGKQCSWACPDYWSEDGCVSTWSHWLCYPGYYVGGCDVTTGDNWGCKCWSWVYDSPHLYSYNGSSYDLISDFLALSKENEKTYFVEIPEEKIKETDGKYKLKIRGEKDEITYLDKIYLKITDTKGNDEIIYDIEPRQDSPLIRESDDNYLILEKGEELFLEFNAPKLEQGCQRKVEFAAEGYYIKTQEFETRDSKQVLNSESEFSNQKSESLAELLGLENPFEKILKENKWGK